MKAILNEAAALILCEIVGQRTTIQPADRYLPMPYSDFAALSRLTTPESVPQFKAAVVSATALFKFKENSSYFPEYCRGSIQAGV